MFYISKLVHTDKCFGFKQWQLLYKQFVILWLGGGWGDKLVMLFWKGGWTNFCDEMCQEGVGEWWSILCQNCVTLLMEDPLYTQHFKNPWFQSTTHMKGHIMPLFEPAEQGQHQQVREEQVTDQLPKLSPDNMDYFVSTQQ